MESPEIPNLQARSYLASDPALVVLYKQLREKTLQTLKGASKISPRAEWEFVIQTARLYDRMGCDILALDLGMPLSCFPHRHDCLTDVEIVRNWEFLKQPQDMLKPMSDIPDPRKMLRRRSSLVVDDMPSPQSPMQKRTSVGKAPAQMTFVEPDANSLLDSFGF